MDMLLQVKPQQLIYSLILIALINLITPTCMAADVAFIEDRVFLRQKGKPFIDTEQFANTKTLQSSTLVIYNGGRNDEYSRVTSANVWLNNQLILTPNDFKQNIAVLEIPVQLGLQNQIDIELRSKPGSALVIALSGTTENQPVQITSSPLGLTLEDELYQYAVQVNDADSSNPLNFELVNAPVGMAIDPLSGLVSWIPGNAQVGTHLVQIQVTDADSQSDQQDFNLIVQNVNDTPLIVSEPVLSINQDQIYNYPVIATDIDLGDTLTYALTTAPAGLAIDTSLGIISGSLGNAAVGIHPVTVIVTDSGGLSYQQVII